MTLEAEGIVSVEFRPSADGGQFPGFSAGSHIDLQLPNGLTRSYSLCNPASDSNRYVIGVLNDRSSRGGSRYVHELLRVGQRIGISVPRNHFELEESAARTVLVAGGIGVTPILCMLQRLVALHRPVELVYCARNRREAAFVDAIRALGDGVGTTWHFDDEQGAPPDLKGLLAGRGADTHYYCCGPGPMLNAFKEACEDLGYANAHVERFAVELNPQALQDNGFQVVCARSDRSVAVHPGQSILDALIGAGMEPDHSCQEGVCGACETRVIGCDGELQHHDGVLSKAERESGAVMMICVSRCAGRRLVLDL